MPNANDYRAAALRLRRLSTEVPDEVRAVRTASGPQQVAHGPVRTTLERSFDVVDAATLRAAEALDRLAAVCDRRAEICDAYEAELARHRLLVAALGPSAPLPARPAWWVGA